MIFFLSKAPFFALLVLKMFSTVLVISQTGIVAKHKINTIESQVGTSVIDKSIICFLQRWIYKKDYKLTYGNSAISFLILLNEYLVIPRYDAIWFRGTCEIISGCLVFKSKYLSCTVFL